MLIYVYGDNMHFLANLYFLTICLVLLPNSIIMPYQEDKKEQKRQINSKHKGTKTNKTKSSGGVSPQSLLCPKAQIQKSKNTTIQT